MTGGPIRVALVGLGGHGETIQKACEEAEGLSVVSVLDPDEQAAQKAAERFDCRISTSYEVLIREDDIDALVLVTPNHLHRTQVESALNAGKHVFVEKPIANTVQDGLAMIQKAESNGLILMIGHHMRFARSARMAKSYITEGRLGDIISTEIHFSSDTIFHLPPDTWRLKPEQCPMLPVMQLAVHAFDLVHYLVGRIEEVTAYARQRIGRPGVTDSVAASFSLEDGSVGSMVSNYCTPVLFEYRISGTQGILRCTPESFWYCDSEGATIDEDLSTDVFDSYVRQMQAFAVCVAEHTLPETDGWAGLQALAVVEAMNRSAIEKTFWPVQLYDHPGVTADP